MKQLILASQSAQRRNLLEALKIEFLIKPAELDEKAITAENPGLRAQKIAQAKGEKIKALFPEAVIVAADSYIVLNDQTLEKPESLEEAVTMLTTQSGQWVTEYTGLYYVDPEWEQPVMLVTQTQGCFRELSSIEIQAYVDHNPVLTWSGAFSPAYPAGAALIAEVKGSLTGFTHGFPMEEVIPLLQKSGLVR